MTSFGLGTLVFKHDLIRHTQGPLNNPYSKEKWFKELGWLYTTFRSWTT